MRFGIGTVAAALVGVLSIGSPAFAYNTWNDHRLTFGVVGQHYWLHSSAVAHNKNAIVHGVGNWNASATPVAYSRTYTKSASRLDFYRVSFNDQYCALTSHWVNTTKLSAPPNQNWWWAKVNARPQLKMTYCSTAGHRQGLFAHEMGHAMGLAHVANSGALMYYWISATSVNNPKYGDRNGIEHLY